MKKEDLVGQKFGRWTVIAQAEPYRSREGSKKGTRWLCRCDCGNEKIVAATSLKKGRSKSCGCLHIEVNQSLTKHGHAGTIRKGVLKGRSQLYNTWGRMKQRCSNPKVERYPRYGGRGITVCEEWQTFKPFMEWALANGYEEGLQIDRIDNNGNYEPENCRWVTPRENTHNTSRSINLTLNGETHSISEWAEITGIKAGTLYKRYHLGWSTQNILTK